MKKTLSTLAVLAAIALPSLSFADEMDPAKMTCAEFTAMDAEGMMKATDAMHMAGPDAAMKMDDMMAEEAMKMTMTHCEGKPDMMAMDAMMMK
ncbi:hypothetical protein [Tabrizicola sp.]|uniref:hypothetical protein n=1 Tax=Tabrizicola sp. TaxID=2005166 RepID=UPI00286C8217|nr:hypothetical protein [Tabrizicola sp.]